MAGVYECVCFLYAELFHIVQYNFVIIAEMKRNCTLPIMRMHTNCDICASANTNANANAIYCIIIQK